MSKVYFTSDWHFLHANIIKYSSRPFEYSDYGAMACMNKIVENYKSVVKDDDIVLNLGDVCMCSKSSKKLIRKTIENLLGHKYLVRGNHDLFDDDFYKDCGFIKIFRYIILNDSKTFISHYPLAHTQFKTDLCQPQLDIALENNVKTIIHGHTHHNEPIQEEFKRINVCIDYAPNNYMPIEIPEISDEIKLYLEKSKRISFSHT